jgi:hypothetical protein
LFIGAPLQSPLPYICCPQLSVYMK